MKTSLIIPIYNEGDNVLKLLDSIFVQKIRKLEVIVIDDGSTDNTKEILEPYFDKIKYIKIKNSGVSRARNVGIKKSTGSLIIFFDGDVILKKDTLYKFIKFFKENKNLKILQGIWEKKYPSKTNYITKHLLLKLNFNFNEIMKKEKKYYKFSAIKVSELCTGCLAIRKKLLNEFKFNENYKGAGGEEFELGSKISNKYDIFLTPKIKVYHKFENFYQTVRRIFSRTINYSIIYFNLNKKKKEIFSKSNELSVPKRDMFNVFILTFFIFFLILSFFNIFFLILSAFFLFLFCFNNIGLLKNINKNLGALAMFKSLIIEMIIVFAKLNAIFLATFIVYILRKNKFKT